MCRKDPFANEVCVARTPSPYTPSEPPVARRLRPPATGHWRTPPPLQAGQVIGLGMESACSRRPTAALLPGARRVVGDDQRQGPGKTQTSTGPALGLKNGGVHLPDNAGYKECRQSLARSVPPSPPPNGSRAGGEMLLFDLSRSIVLLASG